MLQYQGQAVDFHEGPPPSSALWGADTGCSSDPELQDATDGVVITHMDTAQRERLSTLDLAAKEAALRRGRKGKPTRHQLHRTPTPTQQARWEAVQQAREQGTLPAGHSQELGHGQEHREEVRRGRRSAHQETQRQGTIQGRGSGRIANCRQLTQGDIFAFQLRGRNRWTTTNQQGGLRPGQPACGTGGAGSGPRSRRTNPPSAKRRLTRHTVPSATSRG